MQDLRGCARLAHGVNRQRVRYTMGSGNDLLRFARDVGDLAAAAGELSQQVPGFRAAAKGFCRIFGGTPGTAVLNALDISTVCTPYLAEDGRTLAQQAPPPFTGGQCPGVLYSVTATLVRNGTPASGWPRTEVAPGPISYVTGTRGDGGPTVAMEDGNGNQFFISGSPPSDTLILDNISTTRLDGQPDDCGDPPSEIIPGDGYGGEDFGDPQTVTGPDGNNYNIVVGPPTENPGGGVSIPISIDQVNFNFGTDPASPFEPTEPDYNNPSPDRTPGPGGGPGGADNPDDGVDVISLVAAVRVVVTSVPPNASREVGGSEDILVPGYIFDAGWFRWRVDGAFTEPKRLLSTDNMFIFSPGVCAEADGYQVKFSPGFTGFTREFVCESSEEE